MNCRFFDTWEDNRQSKGNCRRRPPQVFVIFHELKNRLETSTEWPYVIGWTDWCGEFQPFQPTDDAPVEKIPPGAFILVEK